MLAVGLPQGPGVSGVGGASLDVHAAIPHTSSATFRGLISHPATRIRYLAYGEMCHLADVCAPRTTAYFPQGATREGKSEESAGSDNHRGQLAPLPLLRGPRARAHRPQRGALPLLPRRPQWPAPGDADLDKPASRRYRSSRLRVRTPGDAAPPGRGLQMPGVRLRGPAHRVLMNRSNNASADYTATTSLTSRQVSKRHDRRRDSQVCIGVGGV